MIEVKDDDVTPRPRDPRHFGNRLCWVFQIHKDTLGPTYIEGQNSSNLRLCASPVSKCKDASNPSARRWASFMSRSELSIPFTLPFLPAREAKRVVSFPIPHPTSSTTDPAVMGHSSSIRSRYLVRGWQAACKVEKLKKRIARRRCHRRSRNHGKNNSWSSPLCHSVRR